MLRKIAILGANGFVGKQVLAEASRRGIEAVGVVRTQSAANTVESLGGVPVRVVNLQRAETESLVPWLSGCDGLIYTASVATGSPGADRTDPAGLANVLAACRESGVPSVVFFSGLGIGHYGLSRHCTNPYFLAKMAGEVALFRSGLAGVVFRPSYIFGQGDEFLTPLIGRILAEAAVEIPGDGTYRLQPISVADAARASLAALATSGPSHRVVDLVGPEVLSYRELILRIASAVGKEVAISERSVEEAIALARNSGYFGLRAHDLDCLLCDEIASPRPVTNLLEAPLEGLDVVIARTVAAVREAGVRVRP